MPIAEVGLPSETMSGPDQLVAHGPTIWVDVSLDPDYDPASGHPPKPSGRELIPALIDTGASESCIDEGLAEELGLEAVDVRKVGGAGGSYDAPVYLVHLYCQDLISWQYGLFFGVRLTAGGQPHRALIGRTFLADKMMIYDGRRGTVQLVV